MRLARGRERVVDADVQLLSAAEAKPDAAACAERLGLLDLLEAERTAVERARDRLATGRSRYLDVVETHVVRVPAAMAVERTLILIKPDAVRRRYAGEILGRIERRGFDVVAGRLLTVERDLAETHYAEHREKPFFGELVDFITSGPTWALVVEGEDAIATMRKTIGATNPANAEPGTIRGDLAMSMPDNLVHGSDSPESAQREVSLWFHELR
jgi:nucleoside-diphosphate kinase